jgi:hypothetical protein
MKLRIALAVVLLATLASAGLAYTLHWKILQVPGASATEIYTINNSNEMVGHYTEGLAQHGLAVIKGQPTIIDDPNGVQAFGGTWCGGVNNGVHNSPGTIVGWYWNINGGTTGFFYDPSNQTFTDYTYPNAVYTYLSSINDHGDFVGSYVDSNGSEGGFIVIGGTLTVLQPPNSINASAIGNNNADWATVQGENSDKTWSSYLWNPQNPQVYTQINVPNAVTSYAGDINNHNSIVYAWEDTKGNFHGAVRSAAGNFRTFDEPNAGTGGTYADGINDNNVIVGSFDYMNSNAGFRVTATK